MIGDQYTVEFTDDTEPLTVTVTNGTDVSVLGTPGLWIYAPGRQTFIPWHRIRAVTMEKHDRTA